jgi:hypothetical protein
MLFQNICEHIENHLHELTPTRPLILPLTNVIITVADFEQASAWELRDVLASRALTELVVADLAIIANERLAITE